MTKTVRCIPYKAYDKYIEALMGTKNFTWIDVEYESQTLPEFYYLDGSHYRLIYFDRIISQDKTKEPIYLKMT